MAYVSLNYMKNSAAPLKYWTCAPGSSLGPFAEVPTGKDRQAPNYCGQCVSYVKQVCPSLPGTDQWGKGELVKTASKILPGTVIATFNDAGDYEGHAAIFVSKSPEGLLVYDQYVYGHVPQAVGPRTLRFGAPTKVNDGNQFYVVT